MISTDANMIIKKIDKAKSIVTAYELKEMGLSPYNISLLTKEGIIEKMRRGLYRIPGKVDEISELYEVSKSVPQGVVCLLSALSWYELTTHIPKEYSLAIPIKARRPILPGYPPIQIYYFSPSRYSIGQTTIDINRHAVKIYDKEKTLCDLIYYRNKIGQDIVREVLDNYVHSKNRNIQKLLRYAQDLRISTTIKKYLEVLI